MALKLYNTLTRKKDSFKSLKPKQVNMYSCGPTVYNYPHIGNYRAYVGSDLLRRYLEFSGYKVTQVMNLTDVDDKTIRDSKKQGKKLDDFTKVFKDAFFQDLKTLNIEPAEHYPEATKTIKEMVALIKTLLDKGFAYKADDGIYFDIKKFKTYGELANIKLEDLKAGASGRVNKDEYEKENAHDFVLWKFWTEDDGDVSWDTEIGKGRPGWHIECSAMSMKYLGKTFDIHTGGIDLVFPHHQNEIAQSEAANGCKFVNYWIHNEWLRVEGKKMSKSLGNFYTLRDLLDKGYDGTTIRYLLLSTHYRAQLNFTFDGLEAAKKAVEKLNNFIITMNNIKGDNNNKDVEVSIKKAEEGFKKSLDDDLNISEGLAVIFQFISDINKLDISKQDAKKVIAFMQSIDKVLGVISFEKQEVPEEIKTLVEKRQSARKAKDWAAADKARDELKKKGYSVDDTPDGPVVRKL
ncbi:MAG: cysteine--tRNA ligase [Nanoarchaeota archaeon]|nr:cysteine--tRNA ligase [Nanoarchaeota archaeon]MBU1704608.1 cysteine--tRNA ligase [Nanoarchaeota archaeon]